MPGALDSAFRKAAESVVKDLATGLDVEIDYVREVSGEYNVATGTYTDLRQTFADIRARIEVINSEGKMVLKSVGLGFISHQIKSTIINRRYRTRLR